MEYPVTKDEIAAARETMNALEYLQRYEPNELVRVNDKVYTTRAHDSLKIKPDGRWYWWSRKIGGHTALDYLVEVKGLTLPEAVFELTGKGNPPGEKRKAQYRPPARAAPLPFALPPPNKDNKRVFAYLMSRGIDPEIINHCFKHNLLYQEKEHHNAVFVGFSPDGTAKYATMRSTLSESTFIRDIDGSDKRFCFSLKSGEPGNVLYSFECAIDALSFATLLKMKGKPWRNYPLLSLGGVYAKERTDGENLVPMALEQYLQDNPNTSRIILCFDNDVIGRGAAGLIRSLIIDREIKFYPPEQGKDYNEYLQIQKNITGKVKTRGKDLEYAAR